MIVSKSPFLLSVEYIYDVTVCVPSGGTAPTLKNILYGRRCYAEMLVRRIPLSQVPMETDEATGQWLQNLYREKVNLHEEMKPAFCNRDGIELIHGVRFSWNG